jgi:hypothetical protein
MLLQEVITVWEMKDSGIEQRVMGTRAVTDISETKHAM